MDGARPRGDHDLRLRRRHSSRGARLAAGRGQHQRSDERRDQRSDERRNQRDDERRLRRLRRRRRVLPAGGRAERQPGHGQCARADALRSDPAKQRVGLPDVSARREDHVDADQVRRQGAAQGRRRQPERHARQRHCAEGPVPEGAALRHRDQGHRTRDERAVARRPHRELTSRTSLMMTSSCLPFASTRESWRLTGGGSGPETPSRRLLV